MSSFKHEQDRSEKTLQPTDSLSKLYIEGEASNTTKSYTPPQPLQKQVVVNPEVICKRVSASTELEISLPASVAWTVIGEFSADWLAQDLNTSTSNNTQQHQSSQLKYNVNVSRDQNVREIKASYFVNDKSKQMKFTEKLLQKDDLNLKYVYTRQPNSVANTSRMLMSRLNNADHIYGLNPPTSSSSISSVDTMELDLELETPETSVTLPKDVLSMIESMENQRPVDLSSSSSLHPTSGGPFINFISSFRVVPVTFTTSKLIWNMSAQPFLPATASITTPTIVSSTPPTPTASSTSASTPTIPTDAITSIPEAKEDPNVSMESLDMDMSMSLQCEDDSDVVATAERNVRHLLLQSMTAQLPFIRQALDQVDPRVVEGIVYPHPLSLDVVQAAELRTEETFARLLVQQWQAQLQGLTETRTGKVGEGPSLSLYALEIIPLLSEAMEALGKEWERQQKRESEYMILKQRKPLTVAPRPLNPLHFVASFLMSNHPAHTNRPTPQNAKLITDIIKQSL